MGNKTTQKQIIWDLLELAVGAQSRANLARLQLNDVVHAAVRHGATWAQVGKWLDLPSDVAKARFADADGSITLDEDVVIELGYIAKRNGLPTFASALRYVLDKVEAEVTESPRDDGNDGAGGGAAEAPEGR